jgi:CheY-like chemotaxis protein
MIEDRTYRIALVEDNPGDIYLIQETLRDRSIAYTLDLYQDGESIVRVLGCPNTADRDKIPDLVLLDLNLPRIEGLEILKSLRSNPQLATVPIGVLTSSQSSRDRERAELAGANRFVWKPTLLTDFLDTVGGAIEDMLVRPGSIPASFDHDSQG